MSSRPAFEHFVEKWDFVHGYVTTAAGGERYEVGEEREGVWRGKNNKRTGQAIVGNKKALTTKRNNLLKKVRFLVITVRYVLSCCHGLFN